ncbi:endonuclease/exonuclease/phosphatase family protein [Pedobacter frigoris]|uniref:Endonuclease/exonuclease/phosphatase family protein n=1 Tax=Pedobacter frigoris TaxID=2571272 RepID=A0A4U1CNW1_9SPHI|nr:endonuclease/exonuclease/phosphatase family protein [Pedobacter frigoris]TKC09637.1 endonuclease/exonuclease/phosphatase family protein [Pedobacter frigoris]
MNRRIYIALFAVLLSFGSLQAQILRVATYNIRLDAGSDVKQGDGWKQRYLPLTQLIKFHDFDIFGSQEVLHNQLEDMLTQLPEYTYTGIGREDGAQKGEYSPIFYKKDKFTLLKTGTFWLSENTTEPNKGWDAVLPRICTWGLFQEKKSKKKFMFFNTHFDHIGIKARQESAKLIMSKINEIGGTKVPAILAGDFNVDQNSDSYAVINNSGLLKDAFQLAKSPYIMNGTFNNFKANSITNSRIDHIFLTKQFKVNRYGVLTDTYRVLDNSQEAFNPATAPGEIKLQNSPARTPSDHYPVFIIVEFQ